MSDSILSALADELDVPPEQAKKLLIAMLREVRKRARREGVRLPEFGTFRESQGRITFEPSPSLSRAVNHRFEGLQSEDLDTAPDTEEEADEDDGGPSTITLGYQDSDWSPLDDDGDDTADEDQDEEEPDTEEFEVPSAADTEEFQTADTASTRAASAEPESTEESDDRETSDTEELYPFVEDVPDGEEEAAEAQAARSQQAAPDQQASADEERDSLSNIWSSEEAQADDETTSFPDEDFDASGPESESEAAPEREPASSAEPSAAPDTPTSEVELDPEVRESATRKEEATPDDGGSTTVRVLTGVLVVLLLGAAGWYVLGQRGTVQPPRETFAQLKSQLSSQDLPLVGATPQESSSTPDAGSSPDPESATEPSPESSASTTAGEAETTPTESTEQASSTTQAGSSPGITPAEGGWTIVVGSRTERAAAQSLAEKYRAVFEDQNLPVDVIPGTVENTTRYRVGIGQFGSRSDAQNFLESANQQLPQGAWPLGL